VVKLALLAPGNKAQQVWQAASALREARDHMRQHRNESSHQRSRDMSTPAMLKYEEIVHHSAVDEVIEEVASKAYWMYRNRIALHLPHFKFTEDAIQDFLEGVTAQMHHGPAAVAKWESMSEAGRRKYIRTMVGFRAIDEWRRGHYGTRVSLDRITQEPHEKNFAA
jgi:hypothetical protein